MNHFLKIIILLSVTIAFFSCSDEFINQKLDISGVATSAIIISPEWDADDYQFKCDGLSNADFKIESKPDWLVLDSNSGKITDSIATIHGSANPVPRFSKTGIYVDQMMVAASGKQYAIPVYYIIEGNPSVQVNRVFEISYNNYNNELKISNSGDGVLLWDIVSMPNWLTVNMSQFNLKSVILGKGAAATLPFTFDVKAAVQNNLKGTIVLKTNDKNNSLVEIAVSANIGTPSLSFSNKQLDFGSSETTKTARIYNQGNGLLIWSIEGLPEWLSVSTANGIAMPYTSANDITFTCNRSNLQPGLNSATFYLKTNDPDNSSVAVVITVRMPGSIANVRTLEGNIVDAMFDKSTNTLFYVTGQPNKLVAYDVTARAVIHEVALNKVPTCLAINEDFTKAAVGHGGLISAIDLNSYTLTRTFEYGYSIYDMEWAKDDWFCFTKAGTYMNNLLWINTSTLETAESNDNEMDEGTYLKKVPKQPYVIAARRFTSPSGITVFDINTKLEKNYRHQSVGNYWFSSDGQYMFESGGNVYRTNAIVSASGRNPQDVTTIGKLKVPGTEYYYSLPWVDYSSVSKSIWALYGSSLIYQFEDNDYTLVKTYACDDIYQPNPQTAAYEVEARYVFANSSGTELSVLRKGTNNNIWSVEFIPVK
jgi:hypothetical protein